MNGTIDTIIFDPTNLSKYSTNKAIVKTNQGIFHKVIGPKYLGLRQVWHQAKQSWAYAKQIIIGQKHGLKHLDLRQVWQYANPTRAYAKEIQILEKLGLKDSHVCHYANITSFYMQNRSRSVKMNPEKHSMSTPITSWCLFFMYSVSDPKDLTLGLEKCAIFYHN